MQEVNDLMIKQFEIKNKETKLNQKKIIDTIAFIKDRVVHGIGNDSLL